MMDLVQSAEYVVVQEDLRKKIEHGDQSVADSLDGAAWPSD